MQTVTADKRIRRALVIAPALVWLSSFLFVTWRLGVQHDYGYYLQHWNVILAGGDPWAIREGMPPNTYGPLYNVLAFPQGFGELLPKMLMSGLFGIAVIAMAARLVRTTTSLTPIVLFILVVAVNPLIWISVAAYGDNDAVVAALVALAALARYASRPGVAGALLGLATLTKYYPALLAPAFVMGSRRFGTRLLLAFTAVVSIGLIMAAAMWGHGFIDAVLFGGNRDATMLSILHAWSQFDSGPEDSFRVFLVQWNAPIVIGLWLLVLWLCHRWRFTWGETSVLSSLTFLAAYKVGHTQFYLTLCVLCAALLIQNDQRSRRLVVMCLPLLAVVAGFQVMFFLRTSSVDRGMVDLSDSIGLVTTPLAFATITFGIWMLKRIHVQEHS